MINRRALFSDETADYKTPYEPKKGDKVTVTLRTLANDVLEAVVFVNGVSTKMKLYCTDGEFDYYTYSFPCPKNTVKYYFRVTDEDDCVFVNRLGVVENPQDEYSFSFLPGFTVPDWAKGAVYYQIYTDRFCNGNADNDVEDNEYFYTGGHVRHINDWDKVPDTLDVHNFYGGDLQGVKKKLDYLQSLGVEVIYFNPLFVSPSNHKYDTQDYDHIDPHIAVIEEDEDGALAPDDRDNSHAKRYIKRVTSQVNLKKSNEYFAELVKDIHARGMKVVIDGVFNHCGSFNKWMDKEGIYLGKAGFEKGAYQAVESPYHRYFRFDRDNEPRSTYEGWWGMETLPKLNYESSTALTEKILSVGAEWVSDPFNVDGWRLDVAADLGHSEAFNHNFWQMFRERVRAANPNAVIFAEHYGNPSAWFNGREWDSVMNYDAFMEPVTWFLTGMEKHSDQYDPQRRGDGVQFFTSMMENMAKFPRPSLDSALNQLSNHDHSRFLTRTNHMAGRLNSMGADAAGYHINKNVMRLAVLIQMTWPGAPGIYYGDEAGQVGWTDPDSRRTYPWGHEDMALIDYHRQAVALRKTYPCLKLGSLMPLDKGKGYIAYGRFDRNECVVVVVNGSDEPMTISIPVWMLGIERMTTIDRVFTTYGDNTGVGQVKYGRLLVSLPAHAGHVYHKTFTEKRIRYVDQQQKL